MTVGQMLADMRDPLGAPMHPVIIQVLLVVLFVLHIFFVTLAVGMSAIALWFLGLRRAGDRGHRLGVLAAKIAPNAVGLGVVTGIAPLLFLQTIYDPPWYAANVLMGAWSTAFIFVVMAAYGLSYLFAFRGAERGRLLWASGLSLALLVLAGFIMHALATVSIHPELWREWYAGDGSIDTSGMTVHDVSLARFTTVLFGQAAVGVAVVLVLVARRRRASDDDQEYLAWMADLGRRIGMVAAPLLGLAGLLWALTQGREFGVGLPLAAIVIVVSGGMTAAFWFWGRPANALRLLGAWAGSILLMSAAREMIRAHALDRFGYRVSAYPYNWDWPSIAFFGITSVMGALVIAYLAAVWLRWTDGTGQTYDPPRYERLGSAALGMLAVWFVVFAAAAGAVILL